MTPKPIDPMELEAAWTVAAILKGVPIRRDTPRAPNGSHDFDVILDDDRTFALEVTSRVDSDVLKFKKALGDPVIPARGLTLQWNIVVRPPTGSRLDPSVKRLKAQLPGLLAQIEPHVPVDCIDVVGETAALFNSPASGAIHNLRQLGVTTANPMPLFPGQEGQVSVGYGGFLKNVPIEDVITNAIRDNAEKLARAVADERHLFIWVTESDHTNWPRLYLGQGPFRGPEFGTPIDVVWIGLWSYRWSTESFAARLWTIGRDGVWSTRGVPATRAFAAERRV